MNEYSNGSMASAQSTESLDSQGKQKSFGRLMVRFAEKTSMQGVPYINNAKLKIAKILWSFLLLAAIGVMIFHLTYLCQQFFAWPKITKVTLGFSNLQLPAVTICNVNVIRKSRLHWASADMQRFAAAVDPSGFKKHQQTTNQPQTTVQSQTTTSQSGPSGRRKKRFAKTYEGLNFSSYDDRNDIDDMYADTDLGNKDAVYEIEETFKHIYVDMDMQTRFDIGHSIEQMLVSCSFNGRECDISLFTLLQNSKFGNCYTLDSKKFLSKNAGPQDGLTLVLYMDNNDYMPGITQGYGARVTVHDPDTIPNPEIGGFFVSTAYETEVALKYVNISRKGKPYGNCNDGVAFKRNYRKTYTRQSCQSLCEQTKILSKCGCYSEWSEGLLALANIPNRKFCKTRKEIICENDMLRELQSKNVKCKCDNPCNEIAYVKTLSTRQWPTDEYSEVLVQSICDDNRTEDCNHLTQLSDKRSISTNFLKLVVYYEDLNYEEVKEEPEIENAQFLSDVGGAIGLWIGLSMLSLFEVFQLICELCDYGFHKCCKNRNKEKRKRKKQQARERKANEARQNNLRQSGFNGLGSQYGQSFEEEQKQQYRTVYDDISPYTVYTGKAPRESR